MSFNFDASSKQSKPAKLIIAITTKSLKEAKNLKSCFNQQFIKYYGLDKKDCDVMMEEIK